MNQLGLPSHIKRPETVKIELTLLAVDQINLALENSEDLSSKVARLIVQNISQQTMKQVMDYHNEQEAKEREQQNNTDQGTTE